MVTCPRASPLIKKDRTDKESNNKSLWVERGNGYIFKSDITIKQGIKNALFNFLTMIWQIVAGGTGRIGRPGSIDRLSIGGMSICRMRICGSIG